MQREWIIEDIKQTVAVYRNKRRTPLGFVITLQQGMAVEKT